MNSKIKIALADDHTLFRKGVEELIADWDNMEVVLSECNGAELLKKLTAGNVMPDICILDINMPEMNGFETARAIKATWPHMHILAVSVYDTEFNVISMLRAGAGGYVLKDARPDALKAAIEGLYKNGFHHSELVTGRILHQLLSQTQEANTASLNAKEVEFLKLCCTEMTYREIADIMGVSHRTIDNYRDQLFEKLAIKSRTGLVLYAIRTGIAAI